MEIASLKRYVFIVNVKNSNNQLKKSLLFFTPSEELYGSTIFSKLSNNYSVIQPYLERIDGEFIAHMNDHVENIALYVSVRYQIGQDCRRVLLDQSNDENQAQKPKKIQTKVYDNSELFGLNAGLVHMYQPDIATYNAIDYAFQKNAIFCINAFVESLLILTHEDQHFRNCFDKAVLPLINRGMDVKDLVNSPLFYAPLWERHSLFSPNKEPVIIPYNDDIEEMEFEDPNIIFFQGTDGKHIQNFDKHDGSVVGKSMKSTSKAFYEQEQVKKLQTKSREEQYEMQYNYIYMEQIQGGGDKVGGQDDKYEHKSQVSISRTLKDCSDIELFN